MVAGMVLSRRREHKGEEIELRRDKKMKLRGVDV